MPGSSGPQTDLFSRLARSAFRSKFKLAPADIAYMQKKGRAAVQRHAAEIVAARIAPAEPRNDGRQTPFRGHPVFIAQHATATCCRGCIATWHGIPAGRVLTEPEQARIADIIMAWLDRQVDTTG